MTKGGQETLSGDSRMRENLLAAPDPAGGAYSAPLDTLADEDWGGGWLPPS